MFLVAVKSLVKKSRDAVADPAAPPSPVSKICLLTRPALEVVVQYGNKLEDIHIEPTVPLNPICTFGWVEEETNPLYVPEIAHPLVSIID